MAVKKLIEKIESEFELESEENCKKEESKKKENEKKLVRKTKMKKKEEENIDIDLKVKTRKTYLQGLGPETRQGPSPTSSYLDSGDLARVTRSSSAGPSLRVEDTRGHKVLE